MDTNNNFQIAINTVSGKEIGDSKEGENLITDSSKDKNKVRVKPRFVLSICYSEIRDKKPVWIKKGENGELCFSAVGAGGFYEEATPGHYIIRTGGDYNHEVEARVDSERPWMINVYLGRNDAIHDINPTTLNVRYVLDQAEEFKDIDLVRFHILKPNRENEEGFFQNKIDFWKESRQCVYEKSTKGHYVILIGEKGNYELEARRDSAPEKSWLLHVYLDRHHSLYGSWNTLRSHVRYAVDHAPKLKDIILIRFHTLKPGHENEMGWLDGFLNGRDKSCYDEWITKDVEEIKKRLTMVSPSTLNALLNFKR